MFASSHNATPSRSASRRSPGGIERPRVSSIQARVSLAACGVYRDMRRLRISESREVTDAMIVVVLCVLYDVKSMVESMFPMQESAGSRTTTRCRAHVRWGAI
jgi:hypothetical protein